VPDDYRQALKTLIEQFQANGDDNLVFVAGDKITSEANLRQDKLDDKTHMGIDGAAMFANELYPIIKKVTAVDDTVTPNGNDILVQSKNGQVFIDPGCCDEKLVNIYSLGGSMIASSQITDATSFRVPMLGIYLVNVQSKNRLVQSKVLIQ
jgi:hypothetical protein